MPCAGAIAALYEQMGGEVYWCGKPHPSAYGTALDVAQQKRGKVIEKSRVLGIGDAARTDLKSAEVAGVDGLFIAAGLHRDELIVGGAIDEVALAALFRKHAVRPVAVMQQLTL